MSKNKLKVVSDCYTCNDAEYYEIGVVNMMAYETPIVAIRAIEENYLSYYICKVKNNKCHFLVKNFPTEILEYINEHNFTFINKKL